MVAKCLDRKNWELKSNDNAKQAVGLCYKNNNFARASRFISVNFLAVTAQLRSETS